MTHPDQPRTAMAAGPVMLAAALIDQATTVGEKDTLLVPDLSHHCPATLVDVITSAEHLIRMIQGVQLAAIAELATYSPDPRDWTDDPLPGHQQHTDFGLTTSASVGSFLADGLSCALECSPTSAQKTLAAAIMVDQVPALLHRMLAGQIGLDKIKAAAHELSPLAGHITAAVVEDLISEHMAEPIGRFRTCLREAVTAMEPLNAADRHLRARATRAVWVTPIEDGMALLAARLPAEDAHQAYLTLTELAIQHHAELETRRIADSVGTDSLCGSHGGWPTMDNLRADALTELLQDAFTALCDGNDPTTGQALPLPVNDADLGEARSDDTTSDHAGSFTPHPPGPARTRTHKPKKKRRRPARLMLHVHIAATTLAGLDDQPAHLDGYGPITADHARLIAEDQRVQRILFDPFTHHVLAVDTPHYRVPRLLHWAMLAEQPTCVFPTCDKPALTCQTDHRLPHPDGRTTPVPGVDLGKTEAGNLQPLCEHHHHLKTHGGWHILTGDRPGTLEWISPTGHTYHRHTRHGAHPGTRTPHPAPTTDADEPAPF